MRLQQALAAPSGLPEVPNHPLSPKQRIFQDPWFVKAQFRHHVSISSAKNKLPECTLKMFLTFMEDLSPSQPKNLFKTF